jgi:hypothetical protein
MAMMKYDGKKRLIFSITICNNNINNDNNNNEGTW